LLAGLADPNRTVLAAGLAQPNQITSFGAFTDPKNVELVIKMLDFGDRIAVFYGALSDLEYTIKVTDTSTGVVKTYSNPAHKFCGGLDNSAF
jgi:hypothetical protein